MRPTSRRWSARRAVGLATGLTLALVGCTATTPTTAGPTGPPGTGMTGTADPATTTPVAAGPVLAWTRVTLPTGLESRTLTTLGDRLLVGALRTGDPPAPAMVLLDPIAGPAAAPTMVPVTPSSPYGFEARWSSVATDGTRVIAIGGANGGAHANVRWTTWSGTAAGVTELPQSFYAFGGWGAGDLVEAAVTPSGDALVGSWGGAQAGLDTAVWTFADPTWTRQDSAGTALESTPDLLAGPRGVAVDRSGLLIAGSALHLTPGAIRQTATLWRSAALNRTWTRIDLPDAGTHSEAVSAHCPAPAEVCVVAGQVDGALAVWRVEGDRAERLRGIPALAVGDQDPVPAPLVTGATTLVVSPSGPGTTVVHTDRTVTGSATSDPWMASAGPSGRPVAAAVVGPLLYVATRAQPGDPVVLWSTPWPTR